MPNPSKSWRLLCPGARNLAVLGLQVPVPAISPLLMVKQMNPRFLSQLRAHPESTQDITQGCNLPCCFYMMQLRSSSGGGLAQGLTTKMHTVVLAQVGSSCPEQHPQLQVCRGCQKREGTEGGKIRLLSLSRSCVSSS